MGEPLLDVIPVAPAAPVKLVDEGVVKHQKLEDGTILLDFGKVAFGNLRVDVPAGGALRFHFGEAGDQGRVQRKPPGSVRYAVAEISPEGPGKMVVAPPAAQMTPGWSTRSIVAQVSNVVRPGSLT